MHLGGFEPASLTLFSTDEIQLLHHRGYRPTVHCLDRVHYHGNAPRLVYRTFIEMAPMHLALCIATSNSSCRRRVVWTDSTLFHFSLLALTALNLAWIGLIDLE